MIPTRANSNGQLIIADPLHHHALVSILVEQPQWFETWQRIRSDLFASGNETQAISFGHERSLPPSFAPELSSRVLHLADLQRAGKDSQQSGPSRQNGNYSDTDIAIVGMSCKAAGADNLDEFWQVLSRGESQHRQIGINDDERFSFKTPFRETDPKRKWFGSFMRDAESFDNKFFKMSPRESATVDPQQRQLLQVAYQAVEQSGYFQKSRSTGSNAADQNIGCYIGLCGTDYENNIACHTANAFCATGNLEGFAAGKVSHHFGWTGPAMVIDTACSSSAVAIHLACQSILSGQCVGALAGGTAIMTSPYRFQNLAGASFLSQTGQCKPFDAKADGYCRGEGVGAVFLKKLSTAIADGDQVFGVIAATAVQQNQNCTPIFVPNSPSLSDLFGSVIKRAHADPSDISVVEAHGTGTAVGDPAEYESVRQVLASSDRVDPLILGSVKGFIGHTEPVSGVLSLIKILLMMHHSRIPAQASYTTLNPNIKASSNMLIPTSSQPWKQRIKASLINNYGASGSNACMVVVQAPSSRATEFPHPTQDKSTYPFWLCGFDDASLGRYANTLLDHLRRSKGALTASNMTLANLSFNLARQTNRTLPQSLIFSAKSIEELEQNLVTFSGTSIGSKSQPAGTARPVVLCFGGQVSTFVGLDEDLYNRVVVLRKHLDAVDIVAKRLGAESIFPGIFKREIVNNTINLQVMLFAIQYACARSWMDAGVRPVALVGHSFGELTALCISRVLSLEDTLTAIIKRAILVQNVWGNDKGAMMAVEADMADVAHLLNEAADICNKIGTSPATIACYNGPRSFTLAGSTQAIDAVAEVVQRQEGATKVRTKRLNITNSFHCSLVDPLIVELKECGRKLAFRKPEIPLEHATETATMSLTTDFFADHLRKPVFFHHALKRIIQNHPSCIFLEAGSNSTVTKMANRALGSGSFPESHYQAVNITCDTGMGWDNLVDATVNLWKAGLNVSFWAQHGQQTEFHTPLLLPTYQFEKVKHWVELKTPKEPIATIIEDAAEETAKVPEELIVFAGYTGAAKHTARFRINTASPKYEWLVSGHIFAATAAICPATVQLDFVVEAIRGLHADKIAEGREPQLFDIKCQSPVCVDPTRSHWIEFDDNTSASGEPSWTFSVFSTDNSSSGANNADSGLSVHTTGTITLSHVNSPGIGLDFARLERLVTAKQCTDLLESGDAEEVLLSRSIYKIFAETVAYTDAYRGVQKLASSGNQSAGYVVKQLDATTWLDAHLADCLCQVAGIWANCMTDCGPGDIYVCNGMSHWFRNPLLQQSGQNGRPTALNVLALHHRQSPKAILSDIFAFDATTGTLVEVVTGVSYVKVTRSSMSKLLARLSVQEKLTSERVAQLPTIESPLGLAAAPTRPVAIPVRSASPKKQPNKKNVMEGKIKAIVAELSGAEMSEIKGDCMLADLGIDSLLGMELAHEIGSAFKIDIPDRVLAEIYDLPGLLKTVREYVGGEEEQDATDSEGSEGGDDATASINSSQSSLTEVSGFQTGISTPALVPGDLDSTDGLTIPSTTVIEAFQQTKSTTDDRILEYGQERYADLVDPLQTQLCIALTLDALDELGCSVRRAEPGQTIVRVPHADQHSRLVDALYMMLAQEANLVNINGNSMTRTAVPSPTKSSQNLYEQLSTQFPDQSMADALTLHTGSQLADVLRGKADGIKLIFGSVEGRKMVSRFYAEWPLHRLLYRQLEDFVTRLTRSLGGLSNGPLKVMEMGAGTGGTTKLLLPILARAGIPVEYTFTDLAPSFVAAARKQFKEYPFMKFRTHNIEDAPPEDLIGTQHILVASNAVHATCDLHTSTSNMRKALRSDGMLLLVEMTSRVWWMDLVFGLFEGWWLFDDDREYVVQSERAWERVLQSAGYGLVDWTDGVRPENKLEKVIIALASPSTRYATLPHPPLSAKKPAADLDTRQGAINDYLWSLAEGFTASLKGAIAVRDQYVDRPRHSSNEGKHVLITGGTGSLGAHIVAQLALRPDVQQVVCLNRSGKIEAKERQLQSLHSKGLGLPPQALGKILVFETDISKPQLGLPAHQYDALTRTVTHIIHSAWLMNTKWPLRRFEPQLRMMRNLLDLAREISIKSPPGSDKITFQFVSSVAAVGHWPVWTGEAVVPETQMAVDSILPIGYGDAKHVCERLMDETLHKHPERFRAMVVRPGQIAGNSTSGYWNSMEHVSFLIKSSQSLGVLPDLPGHLAWAPVDGVAGTAIDLLFNQNSPHPIYHIDNPRRQSWSQTIRMIAAALGLPEQSIVKFEDWLDKVRNTPGSGKDAQRDNPASLLADFFETDFIHMSCGAMVLDTAKACQHSLTLAKMEAVDSDLIHLYIKSWKETGFLT